VLESNKFIVLKCEQFIGKGYVCRGLFRFSVSDFCNKSVYNICNGINESNALGLIMVVNISLMCLTYYVRNMVLYMRGRCSIRPNQMGLPKERITH
jgi:hypothetical protein